MELHADGSGVLEAQTVVGVLRGLETLTQLVHYDGTGWLLPNLPLVVHDAPRLRWRGLLLDSARHFVPVPSILRLIDGMAGQCTSHSTASNTDPKLTRVCALPNIPALKMNVLVQQPTTTHGSTHA